jgi:diphthamide synthase (EF-2-diphthine--ammonia ligase)
MYKIQFVWEKEHKIVEDFNSPPRKEESYRIHAFNVSEDLKNKIVELLNAELLEQLIQETKSYEQKKQDHERKKGGNFLDRLGKAIVTKPEVDI